MNKTLLLKSIIDHLSLDLEILFSAAKSAHEASTHAENRPDNKYDTLALEASYVAQGQANRAEQLRTSIKIYRQLQLNESEGAPVRISSLVTLQDEAGMTKVLFLGPLEGGLKVEQDGKEVVVITPVSPMGKELIGRSVGDNFEIDAGTTRMEYEIVEVL
jgi:transcription elongation GreA/GreB family factor